MRYYDRHGDDLQKAEAHYYLGRIYQNGENDTLSFRHFIKALPYAEKVGKSDLLSLINGNIGSILRTYQLNEEAEPYYKVTISVIPYDKERLAVCYNKLGIINYSKCDPDYSLAKYYLGKAVILSHSFDNDYIKSDIYYSLSQLYQKSGNYESSIKAMRYSVSICPDKRQICNSYIIIGETFHALNKEDSAIVYLKKGLFGSHLLFKTEAYRLLSSIAENNVDKYNLDYYTKGYIACNDSLKEENSIQTKIISSIKDTLNERSVYKYKSTNLLLECFALFLALLSIFVIIHYIMKRKKNELKMSLMKNVIKENMHKIDNLCSNILQRDEYISWKNDQNKKIDIIHLSSFEDNPIYKTIIDSPYYNKPIYIIKNLLTWNYFIH